jgi:hypothetical protein
MAATIASKEASDVQHPMMSMMLRPMTAEDALRRRNAAAVIELFLEKLAALQQPSP